MKWVIYWLCMWGLVVAAVLYWGSLYPNMPLGINAIAIGMTFISAPVELISHRRWCMKNDVYYDSERSGSVVPVHFCCWWGASLLVTLVLDAYGFVV